MRRCKDCGQQYSPIVYSGRKTHGYTVCPTCGSKNTVWLRSGRKFKFE